jgi:chromosome segregation ATPase
MDEGQIQLIVFRLDQVETSIEEMNSKLDLLLVHQQKYRTEVALVKQAQSDLDKRVTKLETKTENLQLTNTDLQIGLAGKLGPGAIAGGVVAGLMLILRFLVGV